MSLQKPNPNVPIETITQHQGTQITSYPNHWILGLVTPWFGYVFA